VSVGNAVNITIPAALSMLSTELDRAPRSRPIIASSTATG